MLNNSDIQRFSLCYILENKILLVFELYNSAAHDFVWRNVRFENLPSKIERLLFRFDPILVQIPGHSQQSAASVCFIIAH